jgi:hypothetical protein
MERRLALTTPGVAIPVSSSLVALVALFSVSLLRISDIFGGSVVVRIAGLTPFVLAIAWGNPSIRRTRWIPSAVAAAVVVGALAISCVAVWRGHAAGVFVSSGADAGLTVATMVVAVWFGYRLFTSADSNDERWWRITAIAFSPAVFVAVNLIVMTFPIPGVSIPPFRSAALYQQATLLQSVGISIERTTFPMGTGVNGSGILAAMGFASSLVLLTSGSPRRWMSGLAALVCFYGLLLTDTRVALASAIAVAACITAVLSARRRGTRPTARVLIVLLSLAALAWQVAGQFSRNSADLATGGNRVFIWEPAWKAIRDFDLFHSVFGWGANGQVSSDVSASYAYLFAGDKTISPYGYTTHNFALQTLTDTGLIGLIVTPVFLVTILGLVFGAAKRTGAAPFYAVAGALVVLMLSGFTEAVPSYLFMESFGYLLIASGALLAVPNAPTDPPMASERRRQQTKGTNATHLRGRRGPDKELVPPNF